MRLRAKTPSFSPSVIVVGFSFFFVFFFFNIQSLLYMSEYFMIIRGGGHVFFREHVRGNQYIIVGEITYNKSYEIT